MQTFVNDRRSPVYAALANLASILRGASPRLILVWRFRGCTSLCRWFHEFLEDALLVFRASAAYCGQVQRRQRNSLNRMAVFGLGDPAMEQVESRQIADAFVKSSRAELGDNLASKYHALHERLVRERSPGHNDYLVKAAMAESILGDAEMIGGALSLARLSIATAETSMPSAGKLPL